MKKRYRIRTIAFLLTVCICFTMLPCAIAVQEDVVRVREIEELRTTNSETFLLSDGSHECVVYAEDKYYEDETHGLQLIDNAIIADSASAGNYKNTANAFDVTFSGSGVPEIGMEKDGVSFTFTPIEAKKDTISAYNRVQPKNCSINLGKVQNCRALSFLTATGNNTVTYADAFTDTDLVYVVNHNALKEYIILGSGTAPSQFSFNYKLNGLDLESENGRLYFVDEDGTVVFTLGQLFAVDSAGVVTDAVTYSYTIDETVDEAVVTIELDKDYFYSPDRVFPIVIDPTTGTDPALAETFVTSAKPTMNWNGFDFLVAGYASDFYGVCRSYLSFTVPSFLMGVDINSASINVAVESGAPAYLKAYRCTGSWTASTLTWNNKPSYTTTHASTAASSLGDGTWYALGVTNMVQNWLNGTYSNYGVVLVSTNETSSSYYSSLYNSATDPEYAPQLSITYDIDAYLMALNKVEYDSGGIPVYFNSYFGAIQDFVLNDRRGYAYTGNYNSMTAATIISRMQSSNMFFIATHGSKTGFHRSVNGDVFSMSDLNGVDLSNLKFVLLLACSCAEGGFNGTVDNIAEKILDCGAETVVAFNDEIAIRDIKTFAENLIYYSRDGASLAWMKEYMPPGGFWTPVLSYMEIGGDENVVLTEID